MEYLRNALFIAGVVTLAMFLFAGADSFGRTTPSRRASALALLIGAGLFALGAWLHASELPGWALAAAAIGALLVVGTLADLLPSLSGRFLRFWLPIIAVCAAGVVLTQELLEREAAARWQREELARAERERERAAAARLAALRTNWQAGAGVAEWQAQPLFVWLAAPPSVAVDWEYEQAQGAAARREIPLKAVLLNNGYEELPLTAGGTPRWELQIEARASGAVIARWDDLPLAPGGTLAPAERRELRVAWDGRGRDGALAAPGVYVAQLTMSAGGAGARHTLSLTIEIRDEGPIVEPDPLQQQLARQRELVEGLERNLQQHQLLEQMRRNLDLMRTLPR